MARFLGPAALCAALVAPALLPSQARAENGIKPRLPVDWDPRTPPPGFVQPTCLEYVDRSADSVYRFSYSIADEDPSPGEELLPDEVADSRTHQFFAMAKQGNPQTEYPHLWITQADVDAALAKGLISASTVGPEEIMESSPLWSDHFERITPDAERRPISNEMVAEPVQWDTAAVDPGVYMLWGYTWEPAFNLWSQRSGNVVIVHDGDPDAAGPAAAITNGELIVYSDEAAVVEGCVAGAAGTTLDGYFSETPDNGEKGWEPTWIPFAEGTPVTGDTFALEFTPGEEYATKTLLVRVVATDPDGNTYEAHMPDLINVLPGESGGCDDESGGGFIGSPGCGGDESTSGGSDSDSAETGTDPSSTSGASGSEGSGTSSAASSSATAGADGGGSGGGCSVRGAGSGSGLALGLLGLLGLLRRRRP